MNDALKRHEHARLELKEKISRTFLKTVSAFANYQGGEIIFGVNDDDKVVGLPAPQAVALKIENMINDSIVPRPKYSLMVGDDGTVTLQVNKGEATPYRFDRRAYQRADAASVEVDDLELNRLILPGFHQSFEQLPAENQDLSFSVLEQELMSALAITALNEDILKTLNLYTDDFGFNNAAALCADTNNFPGVDVARFGDSINEIRERLTCAGQSVFSQIASVHGSFSTILRL